MREIKDSFLSKDEMACVYAGLISVSDYPFDRLNKIIIGKWGKTGLMYIKKKAWKFHEQLHMIENALLKGEK